MVGVVLGAFAAVRCPEMQRIALGDPIVAGFAGDGRVSALCRCRHFVSGRGPGTMHTVRVRAAQLRRLLAYKLVHTYFVYYLLLFFTKYE